ncbi:MAG: hypothetical protein ACK5AS_10525 [Bacteroidota bacterium]
MKKNKFTLPLLTLLLIGTLFAQAQAPQKISYQAVARNASGTVLPNQTVKLRFSVRNASSSGTIVYQETQTATTSNIGLFNVNIGEGTVSAGTFAGIDWSNGAKFMQVELDPQGGNAFIDMGTQQMLSVPYALYAENGIPDGTTTNQLIYWNGSSWVTLNPGTNGQTLTLCNGTLTWTSNGLCPGNGSITVLNCAAAVYNGNLFAGTPASGVSCVVPYTGGNGASYAGQTVASTGVTGLTATLTAGSFSSGSGTVTYTISGTPSGSGTASFALNLGGQSCTLTRTVTASLNSLYPAGSVFCGTGPSAVVDVLNPITGKTWMDRNLGAIQVATAYNDALSYGSLYQWGRRSDGHQCRTSPTTNIPSSTPQPPHGDFIFYSNPGDWLSPQNNDLWQGVNGINNPCPAGYRVPTEAEWNEEYQNWSSLDGYGAFASPLKLPAAGIRYTSVVSSGSYGYYWSSTLNPNSLSPQAISYILNIQNIQIISGQRSYGLSVRCIKN